MATLEMVASAATRRRDGSGCVLDDIQVFGMKARLDNIPSGIKWAMMFSKWEIYLEQSKILDFPLPCLTTGG